MGEIDPQRTQRNAEERERVEEIYPQMIRIGADGKIQKI
jgi:hypothetical protein